MQLPVKFYFLSEHFAGKWLIFVYLGCPTKKNFQFTRSHLLSIFPSSFATVYTIVRVVLPLKSQFERERKTEKDLHVNNRDKLKSDRETMSKGLVF